MVTETAPTQVARHGARRPRRRLSLRLHAVLARGARRGAAMGLARRSTSSASCRRCWCFWVRIGIKESPRYERVTAAMVKEGLKKQFDIFAPARHYPREMLLATADLLLLSLHLDRLVGLDAVLPREREASRLPDDGQLPVDLDVRRDLRLLDLRLAVRLVRPALGHSGLRRPGRDPAGGDGPARQPVEPVLGRRSRRTS